MDPSSQQNPVVIFWDYENCPLSSNSNNAGLHFSQQILNIRRVALRFGRITLFKAYADLVEHPSFKNPTLRHELLSSGVSLTDCPHYHQKEVADKMIIVDMMMFALHTPPPSTMIIISGDSDFSYAISCLSGLGHRLVVIARNRSHGCLGRHASEYLDWDVEIAPKVDTHSRHTSIDTSLCDRSQGSSSSSGGAPSPSPKPNRRPSFKDDRPTHQSSRPRIDRQHDKRLSNPNLSPLPPCTLSPPSGQDSCTIIVETADLLLSLSADHPSHPATREDEYADLTPIDIAPQSINSIRNPVGLAPFETNRYAVELANAISSPPSSVPQRADLAGASALGSPSPRTAAHAGLTSESPDPACFSLMINLLNAARRAGKDRMLRSKLSSDLKARDETVFARAGVSKFRDYAALAERLDYVELGGAEGTAWIALRPHWYGREAVE